MRCVHCGFDIVDGAANCSNCGNAVSQVSVLSPRERESFDGVTIEQDGGERSERQEQQEYSQRQRVYVRQINLGGGNKLSGLVSLAIIGLLIVAFLLFAVPLAMLLLTGAVVIWIINRLFSGR